MTAPSFKERISKLASLLRKNKVGALFLEPGSNFRYVTGLEMGRSERLVAAIVTAKGNLHMVAPAFEEKRLGSIRPDSRIHAWLEDQDPVRIVREIILKDSSDTIIAVGPTTRFFVVELLRVEMPGWNMVSAGTIIEKRRLIKDDDETTMMREACRKTLVLMASVKKIAKESITEIELSRRLGGGIVQFGENSAIPHGEPSNRKLKNGDNILIDTGHTEDGYWSDLTRTFFFGRKTKEFKEIYGIVEKAQAAAIKAVRPGVSCESIDKAARDVIEEAGYGEYFIHRTGHGLGLDIHEQPYLVKGNKTRLRSGMAMTIEPGIYLPDRFGVRIEDDVVVTRNGCKVLSKG